ncbi:hypothetical protein [Streptomyces himalayensis]|uniref:Uncharacterized protein n=1 Tax=Streptomyces himalayensis subsp. himalayensis TaxID=2756131 RepID=A0A7W0I8Y9_9ACTN|nr:hypothetical protein [Streptomyces himalayensis]MBA2946489.1 hypothetical protein [Streptomyces himalayensis subsp. himalayensis]
MEHPLPRVSMAIDEAPPGTRWQNGVDGERPALPRYLARRVLELSAEIGGGELGGELVGGAVQGDRADEPGRG